MIKVLIIDDEPLVRMGMNSIIAWEEHGYKIVGEAGNGVQGLEKIREYIWYTETHSEFGMQNAEFNSELRITHSALKYFLGKHGDTGYYFYYEPGRVTSLDHAFLSQVQEKAGGYVIYADRCALSDAELSEYGVKFKKIPRDISRI